jgi:phospholipase/lecithinase/hemolysin
MVPLRFVALAISGDNITDADNSSLVSWDSDTKTATITTKYRTIAFTAGSNEMVINGTPSVMDNSVQSEITDGRMFIPFRAMGKALGVDVEWIADTKTAVYKVK